MCNMFLLLQAEKASIYFLSFNHAQSILQLHRPFVVGVQNDKCVVVCPDMVHCSGVVGV